MPTATECRETLPRVRRKSGVLWSPGFKIFRFSRYSVAAGVGQHDQLSRAALAWSSRRGWLSGARKT
jgi:hypothetical protein